MTPQEFQTFADNYTAADFDRISFQWEGGMGGDFKCKNLSFRMELCQFLIPQLHKTNIDLLRDLYLEVGKTSEYTFGCYMNFHLLAQEFLERGGIAYLTAYLEGASHTMDTVGMSSRIMLSKERAKQLLAYFDEKMNNPASKEEVKLYNEIFRRRFERLANR